jgi:hypothetical protein
VQNDLEEDPMLRQNVNIYKDTTKMPVDEDDEEGQSFLKGLCHEMNDFFEGLKNLLYMRR